MTLPLDGLDDFVHFLWKILLYRFFSLEKKGILFRVSLFLVGPSVRLSVRVYVRPSVTFLVNVSPPKPLEVETSNFVVE